MRQNLPPQLSTHGMQIAMLAPSTHRMQNETAMIPDLAYKHRQPRYHITSFIIRVPSRYIEVPFTRTSVLRSKPTSTSSNVSPMYQDQRSSSLRLSEYAGPT